ncbi:RecD-like DNA helicase [Bacillus phage Kirov]|uniref:RecD-like DNA helicase n=1 Tax=Bacillus phage Kirov TaxID=2783539 RepID=A0A7S6RB82_9CAUD|nr:Dda-like helicase [Bacillus phage Kirov]QOV08210.1 RecD-like DNA helicase [Bacillus phage Kirov]
MSNTVEIRITPTQEMFFNEEDSYGIYRCDVNLDDIKKITDKDWTLTRYGNISFKGFCPSLEIGAEYIANITADTASTYAGSYLLESIKQDKPITVEQQRHFLKSILTESQAQNIFDVYGNGEDIIGMIQDGTFDYKSVKGLGDKTFEKLREKVLTNLDMSEILAFLSKYGIKYNMIAKLVKEYKNPQIVIDKINKNPYLLTEIKGVGFKKADEIAKAVGHEMTSKFRIDSCFKFIVGEENMNGNSWIGHKQLTNKAIELLNIPKKLIDARLEEGADGIIVKDDRYTTKAVYEAEKYVARKITEFRSRSKQLFTDEELNKLLDDYCERNDVELEENQRQFFFDWNNNAVLLLVGGGGMGKSWLQRILLELIDTKHLRTALLAPTGKASKVMSGYTGREASTIHRKAGVFDNEEDANKNITEDVIIVDESSMCDIFILSKFFNAITNTSARVLFVGDDFQLPSVGVGNFLYDVIHSNSVTVSRLKKVFRQKDGGILEVATKVRNGKRFLNDTDEGRIPFGRDCVFHLVDQQYVKDGILYHYKNVVKRFNPDDVVVLSPTKKGKLGTVEINKELQKIVNPARATRKEKEFGKREKIMYRVGDAVMNTVNTYQIETIDGGVADIFNGDTGKIIDIDEVQKCVIVDFEGVVVKVRFENVLNSLLHCWATTIHKSQGSQYKVVIVVIDKSMKFQLNANLIYTGISRAKDCLLVLGQAEAVNHGIGKFANMERRSFLQEMIDMYNGNPNAEAELLADSYRESDDEEEDCFE